MKDLQTVLDALEQWTDETPRCDLGALDAKIYEAIAIVRQMMQAEPVAWVRVHPDGTYSNELLCEWQIEQVRRDSGAWKPLFAAPQAEQVPPEKSLSCVLTDWEKWALSTGLDERNHDLVDALTEIRKAFDTETSALLQVLYAVREYLPPDGISEKDLISKVISIVDPWPTSLPAAPNGPAND